MRPRILPAAWRTRSKRHTYIHLIAKNSVEEKILQLQEKKRALVDQLISTESSFFKSLTPDDIKVLFD